MTARAAVATEEPMTTTEKENEEGARSFALLLQGLGDGALNAELSETLHDMNTKLSAHAIDFSKAKGTLTLAIEIEIDRDGVVTLRPDVKTKLPKPARKAGRYWLTPGNNLSPENPKQTKLNLKEVPARGARSV
jgi:hypothetical protein